MDAKLIAAMYRLMDLLEAAEADLKRVDSNLSLETILSVNQARQAVYALEALAGINVKEFLKARAEKALAKLTRSGLQ